MEHSALIQRAAPCKCEDSHNRGGKSEKDVFRLICWLSTSGFASAAAPDVTLGFVSSILTVQRSKQAGARELERSETKGKGVLKVVRSRQAKLPVPPLRANPRGRVINSSHVDTVLFSSNFHERSDFRLPAKTGHN